MEGIGTLQLNQMVVDHTLGIAAMAFPPAPFIALCLTMPTPAARGQEVAAAEYKRVQSVFYRPTTTAVAINRNIITWPQCQSDWGNIVAVEFWTGGIGAGLRFYFTPLVDLNGNPIAQMARINDIVQIEPGALAVGAN